MPSTRIWCRGCGVPIRGNASAAPIADAISGVVVAVLTIVCFKQMFKKRLEPEEIAVTPSLSEQNEEIND